jgi:hypothetical protein
VEKEFHLEISTGQGEERTKATTSGFQQIGAATTGLCHMKFFHTVFLCMYMGFSGDMHVYVGFLKERHVHLRKCESLRGRTIDQELLGFAGVV